jgi:hypothetical protein
MSYRVYYALMLGIAAGIISCSPAKIFIVKPAESAFKAASVETVDVTTHIPPEVSFVNLRFKRYLEENLYKDGTWQKGKDLKVEYQFLELNLGDYTERAVLGFGAGTGKLKLNVKYFDASGNELSEIVLEYKVKGEDDAAIKDAARRIAKHTKTNFR